MKSHFKSVLAATGFALLSVETACPSPYPSPQDWRDENIYQIFTDRFFDGDPSNNDLESGRGSPYAPTEPRGIDRKSTRLNSSHRTTSYAVFCLKKKTQPS